MSSTSTEELMTSTSGKDRENNMDLNVRRRKRKDSDVAGTPRKKIKGCNITHSTEPCNKVQEDVSVRKRRAGDDGKMPGKKMRPSEVSVEDFTKQWGKRKASVDAGTSEKKMRCSNSITVSIPTESSPIESSLTGSSPIESSPIESSPTESSPIEYHFIGYCPIESSLTGSSPTGSSPIGYIPIESSPIESSPTESSPIEYSFIGYIPIESSPIESSPTESSPIEYSFIGYIPIESSPTGSSPIGYSPTESSPIESSPIESSPIESSPIEYSPTESSPIEYSFIGYIPIESSPTGSSPIGYSPTESSPIESSPIESSPIEYSFIGYCPIESSLTGSSPTGSSPTGYIPIESSPTGYIPIESSPTESSPIEYSFIGYIPLESSLTGSSPTGSSPTGYIPIESSPTGYIPIESSPTESSPIESSFIGYCPIISSLTGSSTMESSEKVMEDSKDDDTSKIFSDVSLEEEKIFEMASSGNTSRAEFEDKYLQHSPIGAGGFGLVYAGIRKVDSLPVAIKHVPSDNVRRKQVVCNGKLFDVILEVALMLKTAGLPGSVGQSAAISLLDWYTLEHVLILVLERPALSVDLHKYLHINRGSLPEHEAKMILRQLVDAAIDMHAKQVFHRDIKLENTLIQRSITGVPRIRVIDFGCGSFSTEMSYHSFCGTPAYAPPEWFDYQTYWARPTTVWQLGTLFYSLLNGNEYFSTTDFIHNHIKVNSALSRDCKILLNMCLARDPMERASLQELQCCPALNTTKMDPVEPPAVRVEGISL